MSAEDNTEGDLEEDLSLRSAVSLSPWRDCEVTSIISESEYGGLPKICDPRLGSVWVVSVSYLPSPSSEEGGSQKLSTLNGGDLMILYRCASWIVKKEVIIVLSYNTICSLTGIQCSMGSFAARNSATLGSGLLHQVWLYQYEWVCCRWGEGHAWQLQSTVMH